MPLTKKPCLHPCCPELVTEGRCAKHTEQHKRAEQDRRNADEVMKVYHTKRWERFKMYMRSRNPLCQRILDNGKQCEQFSKILHHIISPRVRPDLMFDAANILCVCQAHHPSTEGEEDPSRYVPTVTD
jgi:hypothetical protein